MAAALKGNFTKVMAGIDTPQQRPAITHDGFKWDMMVGNLWITLNHVCLILAIMKVG